MPDLPTLGLFAAALALLNGGVLRPWLLSRPVTAPRAFIQRPMLSSETPPGLPGVQMV